MPQVARGPTIHLHDFLFSVSWPELKNSSMPLRFLIFFHNFLTSEICFSCSVGINFHIKIAVLLERCEQHICIYNTSLVIMHFSMNVHSHAPWESCVARFFVGKPCSNKWSTQTKAPPNDRLHFLKNVKIWSILTSHLWLAVLNKTVEIANVFGPFKI